MDIDTKIARKLSVNDIQLYLNDLTSGVHIMNARMNQY